MKTLDTRDLCEILNKMESERENLVDWLTEKKEALEEATKTFNESTETDEDREEKENDVIEARTEWEEAVQDLADWDDDNGEEFKELQVMRDNIDMWEDGVTLIPEDDFEEYTRDLIEDVYGKLPDIIDCNIDWGGVANALKMDYSEFEYQGTTYWGRV